MFPEIREKELLFCLSTIDVEVTYESIHSSEYILAEANVRHISDITMD